MCMPIRTYMYRYMYRFMYSTCACTYVCNDIIVENSCTPAGGESGAGRACRQHPAGCLLYQPGEQRALQPVRPDRLHWDCGRGVSWRRGLAAGSGLAQ